MAKVSIRFDGIMAFIERGDSLEVLIPNSETVTRHLDGAEAFSHYAWLTDAQPGTDGAEFRVREALAGSELYITGRSAPKAKSGCPGGTKNLDKNLFGMRDLLDENFRANRWGVDNRRRGDFRPRRNPLARSDQAAVTCRVRLVGGRFDFGNRLALGDKDREPRYYVIRYGEKQIPIRRPITAGIPIWTTDIEGEALRVKMKFRYGGMRDLFLEAGQEYTISNLDSRTPEEFDPNDRGLRNQLEDGDFRWYYNLFSDSLDDWTGLRTVARYKNRRVLGPLPVPVIELDQNQLTPEDITSLFTSCKGLYFKS